MNELVVIHAGQRVVLHPGQVMDVGRRDSCAIVVADPRVSREHIRVSWGPGGWVLESVGRGGTFVLGQPVTRFHLERAVEAHLAAPDGPAVRFEPAGVPGGQATAAPGRAAAPAAAVPPAPAGAAVTPAGAVPPSPIPLRGGPADGPAAGTSGGQMTGALRMLLPLGAWLKDPVMRRWPRLLVAAYSLTPLVLLIVLQHTTDLVTLGWVYCLYVAPVWAMVFWFLIRPGPLSRLHLVIAAVIVAAEYVLIPGMTIPWEHALAPGGSDHSLLRWIVGVGLPEELTKALPVMVLALILLYVRHTKLDVRMWMFLAALSGLFFGAYEASKVYVPFAIHQIALGSAFGIPQFAERVFVDGLQHAMWAGFAGFFIGLGTNYGRRRVPLWILGIAVPTVLHGMNDWILTWPYPQDEWVWIAIQAFSLFLFLGYTASAASIERQVRHTPAFRGESVYLDPSRLRQPPGNPPADAAG